MESDYANLGLKCGLEIHQQLNTGKLFCRCLSLLRKDEPDFMIKRKLHAVAGESGEIDPAVLHQVSLGKSFVYEGYNSVCLVELDEEPPHQINKEALKIVLQIAVLLNAKIFPIVQIMRKTVIDGSNTSGFQRTVLIARDGFVETEYGRVGIDSICLEEDSARKSESSYAFGSRQKEEDSARIVGKQKNDVIYNLDRLGIPLVEIATSPDIKNPNQAKEVALHIGNILRSCNIKRGLGTIRQDVNVSIKKGARVEIKGVQKLELVEKAVEKEAERQFNIVNKKEKVKSEVRKVLPDGETEFLRPMPGASRMYPETDLPLLKISRDLINEAKKNLPKLRGESEEELKKKGLNEEMIKILFKENKVDEFKELLEIINNPKLVFKIFLLYPKEIASKKKISVEKIDDALNKEIFASILESLKKKQISEDYVKSAMEKIVSGESFEQAMKFEKTSDSVEERIHHIIKEKPGLSENAYMGLVMKEVKGVSGKEVAEIIRKYLK